MSDKDKFNRGGLTASFDGFCPTGVRTCAPGFRDDLGCLVAGSGPLQLANLAGRFARRGTPVLQSAANAFLVLSSFSFMGARAIWHAPETKGSPLA